MNQPNRKPNRVMTFLYRLVGIVWAYETVEEVRDVIAHNAFDSTVARVDSHTNVADKLTCSYDFQHGLIDLHDDMHDVWHYLMALGARADSLGNATLTDDLYDAAESMRHVLIHVADAAESTVPRVVQPTIDRMLPPVNR
ncbi:hypothetical protein [Streptomyces sp. NPDC053720]|uniref:hypothetical protein n=1 Tax=Streptomyces sp. NPDC053720 TaxID=3154855 RepID=UPI00343606ED